MRPLLPLLVACPLPSLAQYAGGGAASMVGGRPPAEVTTAVCSIGSVFTKLTSIKENEDCRAGCAGSGSLQRL